MKRLMGIGLLVSASLLGGCSEYTNAGLGPNEFIAPDGVIELRTAPVRQAQPAAPSTRQRKRVCGQDVQCIARPAAAPEPVRDVAEPVAVRPTPAFSEGGRGGGGGGPGGGGGGGGGGGWGG